MLLIPPDYVKPFVKRQKNGAADAEAIAEAAQRPDMRFVHVKSEASQAASIVFRARDLVVRQKTQLLNAIRSHLAEFGYIFLRVPPLLQRCRRSSRVMIICRPQLKASCVHYSSISHRVKLS